MGAISQLQFPPLDQLEALAHRRPCSRRSSVRVFDFLAALSLDWRQIRDLSDATDTLFEFKRQRRVRQSFCSGNQPGDYAEAALAAELQRTRDKGRFFDLACAWIQRETPGHFKEIYAAADIISRMIFPRPVIHMIEAHSPTSKARKEKGRRPGLLRLQCWPKERLFVVSQTGLFHELRTLQMGETISDHPILLPGETRGALAGTGFIKGFHGYWIHRTPHVPFEEVWFNFPSDKDGEILEFHAGACLIGLYCDLIGSVAKDVSVELTRRQVNYFTKDKRTRLFDWICQEEARLVPAKAITKTRKGR